MKSVLGDAARLDELVHAHNRALQLQALAAAAMGTYQEEAPAGRRNEKHQAGGSVRLCEPGIQRIGDVHVSCFSGEGSGQAPRDKRLLLQPRRHTAGAFLRLAGAFLYSAERQTPNCLN